VSLSRESLLKPVAVPMEEIHIPELDGSVWVKGMTAADRSRFERQFSLASGKRNKRKTQEIRERLIVACVCDEQGNKLFTQEDVGAIGAQSAMIIEKIVDVAQRLCGMANEDVEAMAGNSELTDEDN